MFSIEIRLVEKRQKDAHCADTARQGWFLPAQNPHECRKALLGVPTAELTTGTAFLVPLSSKSHQLAGVAFLPEEGLVALPSTAIALQQPFANIELWIPENSSLFPMVGELQLKALLRPMDRFETLIWLPSCGLVGIESSELLRLDQLVSPEQSPALFQPESVVSKTQIPDRIQAFSLLEPPSMEDIFTPEQSDIGSQQNLLRDMNADGAPEKGMLSKLRKGWRNLLERLHKRGERIRESKRGGSVPTSASDANPPKGSISGQNGSGIGGVLSGFGASITKGLGAGVMAPLVGGMMMLSRQIQKQREAQIEKLLKLWKRDPDKALKFAIPMGGNSAPRGVASPSGLLSSQVPDFSLGGLFGSAGPTDCWDLGDAMQRRLIEAYRQQVQRELAAKRYRRAAYIYAHLLGEFGEAARTLEKGSYFNEAAELYKKLAQTRDQARCLAAAGRTVEAAELYERIQNYVAAGEVWTEAGNAEFAAKCYRKAVDQFVQSNDPLAAANLLFDKLQEPAEAEELLWRQWSHHASASECVQRAYRWYGDQAKHERADEKLDWLIANTSQPKKTMLTQVLSRLATTYPEYGLSRRLEDCARDTAVADDPPRDELLRRLSSLQQNLGPHDPLLAEDIRRFQHRSEQTAQVFLDPAVPVKSGVAVSSLQIDQDSSLTVNDAISVQGEVFVLRASDEAGTIFQASALDSEHPECRPIGHFKPEDSAWYGLYGNRDGQYIRLGVYTEESTSREIWQYDLGEFRPKVNIDEGIFEAGAAHLSHEETLWSIDFAQGQIRATRDGEVINIETSETDKLLASWEELHGSLVFVEWCGSISNQPYFHWHDAIFTVEEGKLQLVCELQDEITCSAVSPPYTSPRIVLTTKDSLWIYDLARDELEEVQSGQAFERASFLHGGKLAAVSENVLKIYQKNRHHKMQLVATTPLRQVHIMALLPVKVSLVAVVYQDGCIETYDANKLKNK